MPTLQEALAHLKISLEKSNVFAYLPASTDTTIVAADTYQPIEGPFTNAVLENFTEGTDNIVYAGSENREFKVILNVSITSDTATSNVTIAIFKNGSLITGLESSRVLKLTSDVGSWMCQGELALTKDDTVSLQVKCDKIGAVLSFENCQANIFPPTHIIE